MLAAPKDSQALITLEKNLAELNNMDVFTTKMSHIMALLTTTSSTLAAPTDSLASSSSINGPDILIALVLYPCLSELMKYNPNIARYPHLTKYLDDFKNTSLYTKAMSQLSELNRVEGKEKKEDKKRKNDDSKADSTMKNGKEEKKGANKGEKGEKGGKGENKPKPEVVMYSGPLIPYVAKSDKAVLPSEVDWASQGLVSVILVIGSMLDMSI